MIISADNQINQFQLDRFIGRDIWVKCKIPKPSTKYPQMYVWIRILDVEYDDEIKQDGYRVNIILDNSRHYNSEAYWDGILNNSGVFPKYYFHPVEPVEVLTTEELCEVP